MFIQDTSCLHLRNSSPVELTKANWLYFPTCSWVVTTVTLRLPTTTLVVYGRCQNLYDRSAPYRQVLNAKSNLTRPFYIRTTQTFNDFVNKTLSEWIWTKTLVYLNTLHSMKFCVKNTLVKKNIKPGWVSYHRLLLVLAYKAQQYPTHFVALSPV